MFIYKTLKYIKVHFLFIILPLIPLLEGFFFEPKGSFILTSDTFPFMQGVLLLNITLYRIFTNKLKFNVYSGFVLLLLLFNILALVNLINSLSYIIVIVLSFLLMNGKEFNINYNNLKAFVLSYSFIALSIYFLRFNEYSFDILRTRGGVNIYGSNDLVGIPLILLSYSFYLKDKKKRDNDSLIYLLIITLFSILFVRRISIVLAFLLISAFFLFKYKNYIFATGNFKLLAKISGIFILLYIIISKFDFKDAILLRFSTVESNSKSIGNFIEQTSSIRLELWQLGIDILNENILFGIGIGNVQNYTPFSSLHSLFLNNMVECGIIIGTIINLIYIYPLFKILFSKLRFSNKLLSSFSYLSFLLIANFSGINLIQNTGYISGFSTMSFFFIIRFIFLKKNNSPAILCYQNPKVQ